MAPGVGFYDGLLVAMSLPVLIAGAASFVLAVPLAILLALASLPAGGLVGYALFVDPPRA